MSSPADRLQTGAVPAPEGFTPNFDDPTDVLRTINYVTQALSLIFVSVFMGLKYYAKTNVLHGTWNMDDCTIHPSDSSLGRQLVFIMSMSVEDSRD